MKKEQSAKRKPMKTLETPKPLPTATAPAEPTEEAKMIRELRGERSYRDFETYMNEKIPVGMPGTTTFQSVWNWENGVHNVTDSCLLAWTMFYTKADKRRRLAENIIELRNRPYPKVSEEELEKQDSPKILEAVKANDKGEE